MADQNMVDAPDTSVGMFPNVVSSNKGAKIGRYVSRPLPACLEPSNSPNALPPTTPKKIRKVASKTASGSPSTAKKLKAALGAPSSSRTPTRKGSIATKAAVKVMENRLAGNDMMAPPASRTKTNKDVLKSDVKPPVYRQSWERNKKTPGYIKRGLNSVNVKTEQKSNDEMEALEAELLREHHANMFDGAFHDSDASRTKLGGSYVEEGGEVVYIPKPYTYDPKNQQHPNGRVKGRHLVMWHRPRMLEKLLLHVVYECHCAHVDIPWAKVMARFAPGASPDSGVQHINKTREIMITEGHLVPPLKARRNAPQDPDIRGVIRDMTSDDPSATRVVGWHEKIEDPRENFVVPGIIRGSGRYPRTPKKGKLAGGIKNADRSDTPFIKKKSPERNGNDATLANAPPFKHMRKRSDEAKVTIPEDLVELSAGTSDSDADYEPNAKSNRINQRRRSAKIYPVQDRQEPEEPAAIDVAEASFTIILKLSPEHLEKFSSDVLEPLKYRDSAQNDGDYSDGEEVQHNYHEFPNLDQDHYSQGEPSAEFCLDEQAVGGNGIDEYDYDDGAQYGNFIGDGYQPGPTNPANYMTGYQSSSQSFLLADDTDNGDASQRSVNLSTYPPGISSFSMSNSPIVDVYDNPSAYLDYGELSLAQDNTDFGHNAYISNNGASPSVTKYVAGPSAATLTDFPSTGELSMSDMFDTSHSAYGSYIPSRNENSSRNCISVTYGQSSLPDLTIASSINAEDALGSAGNQYLGSGVELDENAAPASEALAAYDVTGLFSFDSL